MSPERSNLVLSADIPDVELCVFVRDRLYVEANGGDGGDVLLELEIVEDSCGEFNCQCLRKIRRMGWSRAYWSFLLRRDLASAGAFPLIRRSCRESSTLIHP
jgi:hypothetical protein